MTDLRAELAALKAELGRHTPASVKEAVAAGELAVAAEMKELEPMLHELRDALTEASEETREAIAGHPLMAVGAAFLLGIIVGRISGR